MNLSLHHTRHTRTRQPQDTFMSRIFNDAYIDWTIMFFLAIFLSALFMGLGYAAYLEANDRIAAPSTAGSERRAIFSKQLLADALQAFRDRSVERASIIQGEIRVSDPSL